MRTTIYVDGKIWREFRKVCIDLRSSANKEINKFIKSFVNEKGPKTSP
jgi:hypothetical protein